MNLEELKNQGVHYISLGFENCEGMKIPLQDITFFEERNGEVEVAMKLSDKAEYNDFSYSDGMSPLQRINKYNDITHFELLNEKKEIVQAIYFPWYDPEPDNPYMNMGRNEYQLSQFKSWNKLVLSIKKSNKRFTLKEILDFNKEMTIIDKNENTYKVDKNNNQSYIENVTATMLGNTYLIK